MDYKRNTLALHAVYVGCALLFGDSPIARAQPAGTLVERAATALEASTMTRAKRMHAASDAGETWLTLQTQDEAYPLVVDLLGSTAQPATRVIYMLAGGSTNFRSSFYTPHSSQSLAHFFAEHGYLVVGVSPREDSVPTGLLDYRFMQDWGLAKHCADLRQLVLQLQAALELPHELLGHSYGAATVLDCAARHGDGPQPERVIALDIYSLDGQSDPLALSDAQRTYAAHTQLLGRGQYVDTTYSLLPVVRLFASMFPEFDSGVPRSAYGHDGTFTFEGLFFANVIDSHMAPGVHTDITGLPGDWLFGGALTAGQYEFAADPRQDRHTLRHTRVSTLLAAVDVLGSGLIALALERDVWGASAGVGYDQDWGTIRRPVIWINSELGYGAHRHAAERMRAAGNAHVIDGVLAGYGHGDMLWGESARTDLWQSLLP